MMNKTAVEIYSQALMWAYEQPTPPEPRPSDQHIIQILSIGKFAELLIKECATLVDAYAEHRIPASQYSELLLKNFEIEV